MMLYVFEAMCVTQMFVGLTGVQGLEFEMTHDNVSLRYVADFGLIQLRCIAINFGLTLCS